jgi:hypothetical protein
MMKRTYAIALMLVFMAGALPARASFDLVPLSPAKRSVAGTSALGSAAGPPGSAAGESEVGLRFRSLQVYGFKPFGLSEADFASAVAELGLSRSLDLRLGYHRLSVLSYGEDTYHAACVWTSGMLRLEPSVRFGCVECDGSPTDRAILVDFQVEAWALPELETVFGARNPFRLGLLGSGERCPTVISAGFGYMVIKGLTFAMGLSKEAGFPTSVGTGAEFCPVGGVCLRMGLRTQPREFSLGLGLMTGAFAVDASSSIHMDLGVTHEAGLTYRRK